MICCINENNGLLIKYYLMLFQRSKATENHWTVGLVRYDWIKIFIWYTKLWKVMNNFERN